MHSPFRLLQSDARAMYVQIMDNIKQLVISGQWQAEQALPSIRELAVSLKVSVITVKRAYQELEKEEVIYTRHGMGSFVSSTMDAAKRQKRAELEAKLKDILELADLLSLDDQDIMTMIAILKTSKKQKSN